MCNLHFTLYETAVVATAAATKEDYCMYKIQRMRLPSIAFDHYFLILFIIIHCLFSSFYPFICLSFHIYFPIGPGAHVHNTSSSIHLVSLFVCAHQMVAHATHYIDILHQIYYNNACDASTYYISNTNNIMEKYFSILKNAITAT